MVSLDVVSLFTRALADEILTVIRDKVVANPSLEERFSIPIDNLIKMLTACVETTYFGMGSEIYQQKRPAMGSPLSPVFGYLCMEQFKELAFGSTSLKTLLCLRYVDNPFVLWSHLEDVRTLLDHVNSIRPSLQLSTKKEHENWLFFLDVLLTRTEQGFNSSVYRKLIFLGSTKTSIKCKEKNRSLLETSSKTINSDSDGY